MGTKGSVHVFPAAFTSMSVLLRQVCLGLPTLRLSWGFQSSAWRVMFNGDLRNVWPNHLHFLFWCLLLFVLGWFCPTSLRLRWLLATWCSGCCAGICWRIPKVSSCWSCLYATSLSRTAWLTWRWCWRFWSYCGVRGLKITRWVGGFWRHLALLMRLLMSSFAPPSLLTTLPRYVNLSTSLISSCCVGLGLVVGC